MSEENSPKRQLRSNKRPIIISPTDQHISETQIQQDNKKYRAVSMSKKDIEEINQKLNLILTSIENVKVDVQANNNSISRLESTINNLGLNIEHINKEIEITKAAISSTATKINTIELDHRNMMSDIDTNKSAINIIQQQLRANKLSIINAPYNINLDLALESISKWCNINLKDKSILKNSSVSNMDNKKSSNIYLEFWSLHHKKSILEMVKSMQASNDPSKFNKILCENIFSINDNNPARGLQLYFRHDFTQTNKQIFNEARKHRDSLKGVWLGQNGYINVKTEVKGKAINVSSIKHLNQIIQKCKNCK